jgi:hypothetical protein
MMLLLAGIAHPALLSQGPITPTNGFVGRSEAAVIYDQSGNENGSDIAFTHTIFSLKEDYENIDGESNRFNSSSASHNMDNLGNALINGVAGDFNGDGMQEYMVVSHGKNNGIDFSIPGMTELAIDSFYTGHIPAGPASELYDVYTGNILVEAGDLTGNGKSEAVIAFVDESGSVSIHLFGLDEENLLQELHSFQPELLDSATTSEKFAIAVADLDKNGQDELLLAFYSSEPEPGSYLSIYSFGGPDSPARKLHTRQLIDNEYSVDFTAQDIDLSFDVAAGDFDGDSIMEIAFGFTRYHEPGELIVFPLEVMDDPETPEADPLEKLVYNTENLFRKEYNWNGNPLNLVAGDANGNGRDELIAAGTYSYILYTASAGNLLFTDKFLEYNWGESLTTTALAELDNREDNGKEILILQNTSGDYALYCYTLSKDYVITNLATTYLNTWNNNAGSGLLVTGDFDGDIFRIGEGVKYTKTDVVQPLVILNAPPTHFDQFGNDIFDVNYCHNGSNCESYATYTTTSSTDVSVSTTLRESWGVSATLKGGGKVLGFGVEAYLTGTYGKNFEKTSSSSQTVTIQQSVSATYDDQIYATVCDYEIWEYTVYNSNNEPRGNIITLKPLLTENRWFPSKERSAAGYIPKHEVGNILSYTPYKDLINPDGEDKIRGSYGSDSYDLDANTDVTFSVNLSNTFNNTVVENREIGVEVGASVSKWGLELSGTASYNRSDLSTHSVSVGSALDISVHLGGVNRSIGETGYNVTPYIYWATSGAMVIDYAARPILPEPGGTNTWWSSNYNKPDPAFILPWRLDPEKGLTLEDEARRYQTKSIRFSPAESKPGDTITISAIINNFSPYPTAGTVPVSFYVGDPANGGTLITDIHGESLFHTAGVIDNQAFQEVSLRWVVQENLPSFPRIYGHINPMNTLSEVHERNNIGWAILGKSEHGGTVGTDQSENEVAGPSIVVYPNPVREQAWVQYNLEGYSDVAIRLYNLQGQAVYVQNQLGTGPGTHREPLAVEQLPAGVYFYSLQSSEFNYTGKILKVK